MITFENNKEAREAILGSIRGHLSASRKFDVVHSENEHSHDADPSAQKIITLSTADPIELFKESLEAVDGSCVVAASEREVVDALRAIISSLQHTSLQPRRIAISDSPLIERLIDKLNCDFVEVSSSPDAASLFDYDMGITSAQAAIAETGTLVLDSEIERNRLVSLLPPVHVAIINSEQIYRTLGDALSALRSRNTEPSSIITFITGPSRTADIELTLAIGVHGPQKLFVVINTHSDVGATI